METSQEATQNSPLAAPPALGDSAAPGEVLSQGDPTDPNDHSALIASVDATDYDETVMGADEYWATVRRLERYHGVFAKMMEMGRCVFTRRIPTAAVVFGQGGELLDYLWNPDYYASLSRYERDYTHMHEALHVMLNHGVRAKGHDKKLFNVAADLVVNHLLVERFGMVREHTKEWWKYIWVDNTFPPYMNVPTDESYEFYYELLKKNQDKITINLTVDCHMTGEEGEGDGMGNIADPHLANEIIKTLSDQLAPEDKKSIDPMMDKHGDPEQMGKVPPSEGGKKAGVGSAGAWKRFVPPPPKPKPRWETIIKKKTRKALEEVDVEVEQWAIEPRRYMEVLSDPDVFLPTDYEDRTKANVKSKPMVVCYMDSSGSCWSMAERFFKCVRGIPLDKFDVSLHSFDCSIYDLDIRKAEMQGGGGTYFHILEDDIQRRVKLWDKNKGPKAQHARALRKYPDLVIMITDGYGDQLKPEFADRWCVLLTEGNSRNCLPKAADVYDLKHFE